MLPFQPTGVGPEAPDSHGPGPAPGCLTEMWLPSPEPVRGGTCTRSLSCVWLGTHRGTTRGEGAPPAPSTREVSLTAPSAPAGKDPRLPLATRTATPPQTAERKALHVESCSPATAVPTTRPSVLLGPGHHDHRAELSDRPVCPLLLLTALSERLG